MTRIEIPKIVRPLSLAGYAPELGEAVVHVWVNPPRRLAAVLLYPDQALPEAGPEERRERQAEALAELWSQGPEGTGWQPSDVAQLAAETAESDPKLLSWLIGQSLRMVLLHRAGVKKN